MSGQDWLEKDFYKTLGVPKDADQATIKSTYRKLARKWHPDQNAGNKDAEEKFKEIGEAYTVLSDPEQRKQYDALRAMAGGGPRFQAGSSGAGDTGGFEDILSDLFGQGSAGNGSTRIRYSTPGGPGGPGASAGGFDDIFSNLFGGEDPRSSAYGNASASGFGGNGRQRRPGGNFGGASPQKGGDLQASTSLGFRQALEGSTVRMAVDGHSMTVRVPAGVKDGQKIRLRGKGQTGKGGGQPGDLVLTVQVEPHPVYSREGDNLRMHLPLSMTEATIGAQVPVPLIDGTTVQLKVPAGTSSGTVLRVRKRGVKHGKRVGDLLVETEIAVPAELTDAQRQALLDFDTSMEDWDPRAGFDEKARS